MAYLNLYVRNKPSASKRSAAPSPGGTETTTGPSIADLRKMLEGPGGFFRPKKDTGNNTSKNSTPNPDNVNSRNVLEAFLKNKGNNTATTRPTPSGDPPSPPPGDSGGPPPPPPIPPGGFGSTKATKNEGKKPETVQGDGATNTNTTNTTVSTLKKNPPPQQTVPGVDQNELLKKLQQRNEEKPDKKDNIIQDTTGPVEQSTGNFLAEALMRKIKVLQQNPKLLNLRQILAIDETQDYETVKKLKEKLTTAKTRDKKLKIYETLSDANLELPDLGELEQMYKGEIVNTLLGNADMNVLGKKINFANFDPKIDENNDDFIPYLMALWAVHEDDEGEWDVRVLARVFARVMHFS